MVQFDVRNYFVEEKGENFDRRHFSYLFSTKILNHFFHHFFTNLFYHFFKSVSGWMYMEGSGKIIGCFESIFLRTNFSNIVASKKKHFLHQCRVWEKNCLPLSRSEMVCSKNYPQWKICQISYFFKSKVIIYEESIAGFPILTLSLTFFKDLRDTFELIFSVDDDF